MTGVRSGFAAPDSSFQLFLLSHLTVSEEIAKQTVAFRLSLGKQHVHISLGI